MIISASRRTDIPAFYTKWFMNRIVAGYCTVPNPFNHKQVSHISLLPDDAEVIVFWTRNAAPLTPYLSELDKQGYHYYFQYTLLDYPRKLEPATPLVKTNIKTFKTLADLIGPEKVIWRYDPIIFSNQTGMNFHLRKFSQVAKELRGFTNRVVISFMDPYQKATSRIKKMEKAGFKIINDINPEKLRFQNMITELCSIAKNNRMEITSCAEEINMVDLGIIKGKCIDDDLIEKLFDIKVPKKKDPYQRKACSCVASKDIGMYDTCLYGCQYCYATQSFEGARINFEIHDPTSPSLIGHYDSGKNQGQNNPNYLFEEEINAIT